MSPFKDHFEDDFPFPQVGYASCFAGYMMLFVAAAPGRRTREQDVSDLKSIASPFHSLACLRTPC